jgi:hypothetical protein
MSEADEQAALIAWARLMQGQYPELRWLHSIPNGAHLYGDEKRRAQQMNKLKAQGLLKGIPDLHLPVARDGYHSLYIEMKYDRNKPSEEQEEVLNGLAEEGNLAVACWSAEEAIQVIIEYLTKEKGIELIK